VVDVLNLDTGEYLPGWWQDGKAYIWPYGGPDPLLPAGRYSVMGNVCTYTQQKPWYELSNAIGGDPELVLDRDREVVIDARQGNKVEYRTHRPSESPDHHIESIAWNRTLQVPGQPASTIIGSRFGSQEFYVIPNSSTAKTGSFEMSFDALRVAPALTMRAERKGLGDLHPWYARNRNAECDQYAPCIPPFRSDGEYRVVDAGKGTPAELAAARVKDKVVLVHEAVVCRFCSAGRRCTG
jgi:hypothetical protein